MNLRVLIYSLSCIVCLFTLCSCTSQNPVQTSDPSQITSEHPASVPSETGLELGQPIVKLPEATFPEAPETIQSPADAVNAVFSAGNGYLSLVYGGTEYPAYDLDDPRYSYSSPSERFLHIISLYQWEISPDPHPLLLSLDLSVFILTSRDHAQQIRFCSQKDTGIIVYETADEYFCWTADISSYQGTPARTFISIVRRDYDNLNFSFSRIRFRCAGDAAAVVNYFLKTALREHLENLEPESIFRVADYLPYGYSSLETSSDGKSVKGFARIYIIPEDPENTGWYGMNTIEGMGKYAGWLMMEMPFVLQQQEDGYWQFVQEVNH